ncbi:MAG TPA: RNA-binding transcriptional accessory protein [Bdellovibrionales bacterium]|nr:RNA-binding transcriptional accessory protein [Pseudobdellovibrionaceae bacterium]HAG92103.1 RNA-binding transcriptional accessory protein [Bdellovibrionales bacterium]|tara:strand:- start:5008 stop:7392 length:2385 start_codon:yes stop_codon:yes gene_type:complete
MSNLDSKTLSFIQSRVEKVSPQSINAVLALAEEGATVPFIARYRKEKTGNLDEVQIREVIDSFQEFGELVKRKTFVLQEIEKQGNLTDDLKKRIEASSSLPEVEELYRPFKRKKKTKATLAREAGLGPLADWIWGLAHGEVKDETTLEVKAKDFVSAAKGYATYEEALRGAQHILVEKVSNDPDLRSLVREELFDRGQIKSEKTKDFKSNSKYSMYAEFSEPIKTIQTKKASHRYLALRRGWQEGELKVSIEGDEGRLQGAFEGFCMSQSSQADAFMKEVAKHALAVHVMPSIVNELHSMLKEKADGFAIEVFAENVKRVLMSSPFGSKVVLGVDPGIRTGCKIALVDKGGNYVSDTVLHIEGEGSKEKAKTLFGEVLKQIKIESIAVGNGTGGREAESFIRETLKELGHSGIPVIMVNEAGASVYSASDVAREEFPKLDVTVRGAISIARRLQDPLSELVKIDPKSIGVGQYQHDVNASRLKKSLSDVVESCVNQVGVDLNTASLSLLQYVSGVGPGIAKNILDFRKEHGLFSDREELLKVPRFSSKVFEQSAGFFRVLDGKSVLDKTGIHPERYSAVREMAKELGVTVASLIGPGAQRLKEVRDKWAKLVGEFTFDDIVMELEKPGRDPRDPFKVFQYRDDIHEVKDLKEGMICPGIVTNVTGFGAFVDVGVHQDGLVHISELSHNFVEDPNTVVKPGDQVQVKVLSVDLEKNQISFTMKLDERPQKMEARAPGKGAGKSGGKGPRKGPGNKSGGRGGRKGDGRPNQGRPESRPKPAFNNPFAALGQLNKNS